MEKVERGKKRWRGRSSGRERTGGVGGRKVGGREKGDGNEPHISPEYFI